MINTFSKFYYGHVITPTNRVLEFKEGDTFRTALLKVGSYTATTLMSEVKRAMDAEGENTYAASFDRETRKVTITADDEFDLLIASGEALPSSVFPLLGFTGADRTGEDEYEGDSPSGEEYVPPFYLQNYLDSAHNRESVEYTEMESASGNLQGVSFGSRSFTEFNIKWVRAENYSDGWITTTTESVNELIAFMRFITEKHPLEFMKDRDEPSEFETIRYHSGPGFKDGSGFKLKELYGEGLPGFFESDILRFRVL